MEGGHGGPHVPRRGQKGEHRQAAAPCTLGSFHTGDRVLNHQAASGIYIQHLSSQQENRRIRFALQGGTGSLSQKESTDTQFIQ